MELNQPVASSAALNTEPGHHQPILLPMPQSSGWENLKPSETEEFAEQAQYWLRVTATCFAAFFAIGIITGLIMHLR